MTAIPDIARTTAEQRDLFVAGSPVVALVSGGSDSVALLRLLADGALGETGHVSALHVNHLLRGADADGDAAFVQELATSLGVPCAVVRFDVAAYAEAEGLNLEDAGRRIRYRFAEEALEAACDAAGAPPASGRIATGHTRDDRVETFLMRAITGSGAAGLSSIAHRRDRIVRPLLDCDRAGIRAWLGEAGQGWREDATNADTSRLRALVRAEIVPVAERVNPAFRETLARSIELLAADDALLSRMAADFARDFADTVPGRVEFDRDWMLTLDRAMARRTIRSAIVSAFPESSRIEAAHIEALVDGLAVDGFARDLPDGLRAQAEYGKLVVSRADEIPRAVAPSLLPIPGTADLGPAGRIIAEEVPAEQIADGVTAVTIDAENLGVLTVDAVRPGDRMRPLGMAGTRKLSDMLGESKVVRRERAAVPVVKDGERVVWLAGVRMSEEYKVRPDTTRAVRLTWLSPKGAAEDSGDHGRG